VNVESEALLAVYGDVATMQHLNSELPATVDEAREWVQTKIDLFDRDGQLSLRTVIRTSLGRSSAMSGFSTRTTVPVRLSVSGAGQSTILASRARLRSREHDHRCRI
jgi:hypothetical protein